MTSFKSKVFGFIKRLWYVIIIIIIGVGLYVNQQRAAQLKKTQEETYVVKRQNIKDILTLSGQIDADEHVVLQFQSPGLLSWIGVKEGDTVKKYQTIASLDQRSVKKNLQKSLNTYAITRNSFDQAGDTNNRIGDQPTDDFHLGDKMKRLLEDAQYNLNNSVLDVELSNLAMQYASLTTPIEGIVTRIDSKYAGVNISLPSQAEFEILNPKTLFFSFTADQTEITSLKEGMNGRISLDSFPDKTKDGALYFLSYTPKTGETGTVYEGRVHMTADAYTQYRYGMTGDVEFVLNEKNNVVVIPDKFIKAEGDKKYVWKSTGGKENKTYITTGLETDNNVEIFSGIQENDSIVNVQN